MPPRAATPDHFSENAPTSASASRDAVYRRLLAAAHLVAATIAFVIAIPLLGHDSLGVWVLVAIVMVVLVQALGAVRP